MRHWKTPWLALIGVMVLTVSPVQAAPPATVRIETASEARLGILTTPLIAAVRQSQVSGFARVLDPGPLAVLDTDIEIAQATFAASQAEAQRTAALAAADATVSHKVAEAARAQARADGLRLNLLRRRVGLEWGPGLAVMSDSRRHQLVSDLADGRAALLRVDAPLGLAPGGGGTLIDLGQGRTARAASLGASRVADTRLQSAGVLALVTGPAALYLGTDMVLPARFSVGRAATGVILPREALLRTGGQTFAYVRQGPGVFQRRVVFSPVAEASGLFAAQGFRPGEAVVTKGAAQLFAAESGPSGSR